MASKYGPMTAHDFSHLSQACMFQLFPDVPETKALGKNQQEPPVIRGQPELELDFEQVLNTRRYPSCFIFCLQLYLETRNILDGQREMAEHNMELVQYYALSDFPYEDKTLKAENMGVTEELSEWDLFATEPVWPSILDFRTKLEMTVLSMRLLARISAPLWTGVLYRISRRDHPDTPAWPEMDKFLGVHGTELLGL
ncbi:hypothetical protein LY76DRAFT_644641 [Colletotrichum caudatum]|nr:hypothetical protein LY76DRAFT_644641 [Colletotrichum caudatum]